MHFIPTAAPSESSMPVDGPADDPERSAPGTRAPGRSEHVITVTIDESGGRTRAVARMHWHDGELSGVGQTRPGELFPDHASERLAVSRALSDLAGRVHANVGA